MAFTKDLIELSRRAGRVFSMLDRETADRIRPIIQKASSFDDLPKDVQQIIIKSEKNIIP